MLLFGNSLKQRLMELTLGCEQEEDGRWIAEITELPGVLTYGRTPEEAIYKVQALGLRVLADRIEHDEETFSLMNISFAVKMRRH